MPPPSGPDGPDGTLGPPSAPREIRRAGSAFGFDYEVGVRVRDLSGPGAGAASPGAAAFVEEIRGIVADLLPGPWSPVRLNRAAARLDGLGRRLHGRGWAGDREVGERLTAAVRELGRARDLPEPEREDAVRGAVDHLVAAADRVGAGPGRADAAP